MDRSLAKAALLLQLVVHSAESFTLVHNAPGCTPAAARRNSLNSGQDQPSLAKQHQQQQPRNGQRYADHFNLILASASLDSLEAVCGGSSRRRGRRRACAAGGVEGRCPPPAFSSSFSPSTSTSTSSLHSTNPDEFDINEPDLPDFISSSDGVTPDSREDAKRKKKRKRLDMKALPPDIETLKERTVVDTLTREHVFATGLRSEEFPPEIKSESPSLRSRRLRAEGLEVPAYMVSEREQLRHWGTTGEISPDTEIHLTILLSDVMGWEDPVTRKVADDMALGVESVILVPDLFRGRPWRGDKEKQTYEEWRVQHSPENVSADIRRVVAWARQAYQPVSLAVVGFCYGGGRALEEAAAGVIQPDVVAVFCPTRYDVAHVGANVACPVYAVFAGQDVIPGATFEDAKQLQKALIESKTVEDYIVRTYEEEKHGFVHRPATKDDEFLAEGALILGTAWLNVYLQVHRPVSGRKAVFGKGASGVFNSTELKKERAQKEKERKERKERLWGEKVAREEAQRRQ